MRIKANTRTVAGVHTHTHTSNILKAIKVNKIDKKQIEPSSICVFLI